MRKVIAAINMTLDGICDHTAVNPDEEIHEHYADLLKNGGVILYGRITYELMGVWQTLLTHPSGNETMDDFAKQMDNIPKVVFSNSLKSVDWSSARLATKSLQEEVMELKQQKGNDIFVGSRSLIIQLLKQGLLDELQLCIHPVIAGSGLALFHDVKEPIQLALVKTKTFRSGPVVMYYTPKIS